VRANLFKAILPTGNLLHVPSNAETPGAIELKTTDFSRIRLEPVVQHAQMGENAALEGEESGEELVCVDLEMVHSWQLRSTLRSNLAKGDKESSITVY